MPATASSISASRRRARPSSVRSMPGSKPRRGRCSRRGPSPAATPGPKRAGSPIPTGSYGRPSSPPARRPNMARVRRWVSWRRSRGQRPAAPRSRRAMAEGPGLGRRLAAEGLGAFFLFATVIGSGIMAENLSHGNDAVALLANTLATAAMLFVLIAMLGPISGAHMNPAVSLVAASRRELTWRDCGLYMAAQLACGILGAWAAHLMFDLPMLQLSVKARTGVGQWAGEAIATFGLVLTILGTVRHRKEWVPASVALYIAAAYWFTSSTSFAN